MASGTSASVDTKSFFANVGRFSRRSCTIGILVKLKLPITTRVSILRSCSRDNRSSTLASHCFSFTNDSASAPGRASSSSETSIRYSVCKECLRIGLTSGSPDSSSLKSRRDGSTGVAETGSRITGELGGAPLSTAQVARPIATNSVSTPFSSKCSWAFLCIDTRRLRASSCCASSGNN